MRVQKGNPWLFNHHLLHKLLVQDATVDLERRDPLLGLLDRVALELKVVAIARLEHKRNVATRQV